MTFLYRAGLKSQPCGYKWNIRKKEVDIVKAIFLDIDGVLNNRRTRTKTPERCTGISEPLLKRLGRIVESTMETSDDKTEIVLTSSWKYLDSAEADYKYMCSKLKKAVIESLEVTRDPGGNSLNRGQGIIDYISENPEIS